MKLMNNRGSLRLTKKGLVILIGSVLGVALIAWILLVVGIFRKDKDKDKDKNKNAFAWTPPTYDIPAVPEGCELVFKVKKEYLVSELGIKTLYYSYEYDENGNEILCTRYDELGKVYTVTERTYDAQNNILLLQKKDADGTIVDTVTYTYDQNGNLTECLRENPNGVYSYGYARETYEYYENGKIKQSVYYNERGEVETATEFYPSGKVKKYTEDGLAATTESYYDEDGNLLKVLEIDGDKTSVKEEYTYVNGFLLEMRRYPGQEDEIREEYVYDENEGLNHMTQWLHGRKTEEKYYKNGKEAEVYTYREDGSYYASLLTEYDDNGGRTRREFNDAGTETHRTSYDANDHIVGFWRANNSDELEPVYIIDYDEDGFCIKGVFYTDGAISSIEELEYERERWINTTKRSSSLASKTITKNAKGEVLYYLIQEFGKDYSLTKKLYYKPDGSLYNAGEETGYNGFVRVYDDYGNCVRDITYNFGREGAQTLREYVPLVVPKDKGK